MSNRKSNLTYRERALIDSYAASCSRLLRRGASSRLGALWLLADHALLTLQRPAYVTVGLGKFGTGACRFSSLSEPDRVFLGINLLLDEQHTEGPDRISAEESGLWASIRSLPTLQHSRLEFSHTERTLAERVLRGMLRHRLEDLRIALEEYSKLNINYQGGYHSSDTFDILKPSIELAEEFQTPLRERLARVVDSIATCELAESPDGDGLNIFVVVRKPGSQRIVKPPPGRLDLERGNITYGHSAALFLSDRQRRWLADRNLDYRPLENPLNDNERSIADSVIVQGNVDFSHENEHSPQATQWSRQFYGSGDDGRLAQEQILYQMAFNSAPEAGRQYSLFYVPIHVGGLPWISVFAFNNLSGEDESWNRNYWLYRDLVPLLADAMSRATEEAFSEVLATGLAKAIIASRGSRSFVSELNRLWEGLAWTYPYGRPQLSLEGEPHEEIIVDGKKESGSRVSLGFPLYLRFFSDSFTHLPYRLLNQEAVRNYVARSLRIVPAELDGQYKDLLFVFGHHSGRLFQESGVIGLDTSGDPRLVAMKQRLLCSWSLSEALRALKSRKDGFPKHWLESDPTRQDLTDETLAREILGICKFYLGGMGYGRIDFPKKWLSVIQINEEEPEVVPFGRMHEIWNGSLPHLAPFVGGGMEGVPAVLALTLGLGELLRNSRGYICQDFLELGKRIDGSALTEVLRVNIRTEKSPVSCSVSIINICVAEARIRSEAIEKIQLLENVLYSFETGAVVMTETPARGPVAAVAAQGVCQFVTSAWHYYPERVIRS